VVAISSGQVYLVTAVQRPPFRELESIGPLMPEPQMGTRDHREWAYGMGKRAMESALQRHGLERGLETVALRLPVVQGAPDPSLRLWAWIERMRDGGPVLLPEGGSQSVRFVHAADAARALHAIAQLPGTPPVALNWAQPEDVPLGAFLAEVAALAGLEPRFVPVGAEALARAGLADTCAPYWGRWCSRPDPSAASALLGLRPQGPADWLASVVQAHLAAPPRASHPGYARRAEELALAVSLGA
jgi:nucleoside-diphosphate-sugar epimerase